MLMSCVKKRSIAKNFTYQPHCLYKLFSMWTVGLGLKYCVDVGKALGSHGPAEVSVE